MYRTETIFDGDTVIATIVHDVTWNQVRRARDAALEDTDWWAGKDVTLTAARKEYRIFLRDLPQNYESANEAADAWAAYNVPE